MISKALAVIAFGAVAFAATPVSVTQARVDYAGATIIVFGNGFAPMGIPPKVSLAGTPLSIVWFRNMAVGAKLPSFVPAGSYGVTVTNSQFQSGSLAVDYDNDPAPGIMGVVTDGTLHGSGTSASPLGVQMPASLTVDTNAPVFQISAPSGDAIVGVSGLHAGLTGSGPVGVYAVGTVQGVVASLTPGGGGYYAIHGTSLDGVGIGVYGENQAPGGLAGSFSGDVLVSGTLTKAGGSFKIDHPLDPANKYLSHSFVESPDMMNIYNGIVITDRTGLALVVLPEYFSALNRDFRYQLTVIGQFAQAVIAGEIQNNAFTIRTDKPSVKVSWQVTGIRQDAWANAHRIPTEEEKPEKEKGFYMHPDLFSQPPERNVEVARHPVR